MRNNLIFFSVAVLIMRSALVWIIISILLIVAGCGQALDHTDDTKERIWIFYIQDDIVYIGNDIVYQPTTWDSSDKDLVDVDAQSFKQVFCADSLADQRGSDVEVYADQNYIFVNLKWISGMSILHAYDVDFDYGSLECQFDLIFDDSGELLKMIPEEDRVVVIE